jgi:hypothetical protein
VWRERERGEVGVHARVQRLQPPLHVQLPQLLLHLRQRRIGRSRAGVSRVPRAA